MGQKPPEKVDCVAPHFIAALSENAYGCLKDLTLEFYNACIRTIEAHSHEPPTRVGIFNAQLVDNLYLSRYANDPGPNVDRIAETPGARRPGIPYVGV
jgi:hypothetical protein